MIIEGIHIDRPQGFTPDEIVEIHRSGKLRGITLHGYLSRWDGKTCRFVHWTDPTANRMTPDSEGFGKERRFTIPDPLPGMQTALQSESPIRKRTPQERLASFTNKLMQGETGQEAAAKMLLGMLSGVGDVDGLSDEQVQKITGASWKKGDPLDGDTVRRVAAHYLGQAERKVAEETRQTNTRAGRKARREQERLEAQEKRAWDKRQRELEKQHELTKKYL